ncbi:MULTISPECIES: ABC transporter substrate-binding protein [unclassified Leifsonia]|uniref:ABC transporter substrate-binding protein n=1 Tax=unclassified Leifsonia TaxID=2663824 RepID=UPI0006F3929F|nr:MULTISPECIES: ABC transporter substrate-binding protein [unclassified Leifsonia]KQX07741.1 glycine/betaine ABC transporter [Leifsonia sp. Root1293]KRA12023.1 glycine/betaine ABC transporter [Leifsonia sp. Root60]
MTKPSCRHLTALLTLTTTGVLLAGCATGNLDGNSSGSDSVIVVGSQDYYSNEILAEIYAQALEAGGFAVERDLRIGQREVYVPEIESGAIDLFPEYTGPLLQVWEPDTPARLDADVYDALVDAAPAGVRVLDESAATDQDAFVVTEEFAEQWGLTTINDLSKVTEPLTLGANSEAETRPFGPAGLEATYGVDVAFTPIEDGGGPLTVKALRDGTIQLAVIYTADPSIEENNLVALEDTEGLFLASHVVPVASDALDKKATAIVNAVSAALSADGLVALNAESVNEQASAASIAKDWLEENPLP